MIPTYHTNTQKKTKHSRVGQFPLNAFLLRGIDYWLVYYLSIPSRYANFEHDLFKNLMQIMPCSNVLIGRKFFRGPVNFQGEQLLTHVLTCQFRRAY